MFDGTVKPVENVRAGDLLVGPDSRPRQVLSTCTGREPLYRVRPKKGDPYVVNESHILSLCYTRETRNTGKRGGRLADRIVNIDVRSYLAKSRTFRHVAKGWRSGVDWNGGQSLPIDPYLLGVWLGDGDSNGPSFTTVDPEIVACLEAEASARGLNLRHEITPDRAPRYHVSGGNRGGLENSLRTDLRTLGLLGSKHIPLNYKTANRAERLAILAGILDTDGSLSRSGFDIVFKSEVLAKDTAFVARSLGFAAYIKPCHKTCTNNGVTGDYFRISISGDCSEIPVRIARKKAPARQQKKSVLKVGIAVEPIGEGEYFGFTIDGDRLFLLGDFTVTHNTMTASTVVHGAAERRNVVWWLTHRRELADQASRTFWSLGIPHGTIKAGHVSNPNALVQVASIQTIGRRLDALPAPTLIVFDESHHIGAKSWSSIFDRFPSSRVLGLTATPWRLDGQGLGQWFGAMVEGPTTAQLIDEGSLCRFRLFAPAQPDLAGIKTAVGDYQKTALAKAMDKPTIVGDAIGHYRRLCSGKRAVVFAAGVANSQNIVSQFRGAGIAAEHVDGSMANEERDAAVERFRRGETLVLSNADLFGEGFDVPAIEAAILLRPTKSLSLYLQQVGRALRPMEGKSEAIILDHAGNSQVHGLPDDEREWTLDDREKKRRGAVAEVSVKQCPECFFVYRPASKCPQCGFVPVVAAREVEHVEGTLEEVDKSLERRRLKREESACKTLDDWRALAAQRGYKDGWAYHRFQARQRRAFA